MVMGQSRSFCFVDDLVDGLILFMNGASPGPINLGNPDELTIRQLAELVRARINPDLPLIELTLPADDPVNVSLIYPWPRASSVGSPKSVGSRVLNPQSLGFSSCWADFVRLKGRLAPLHR